MVQYKCLLLAVRVANKIRYFTFKGSDFLGVVHHMYDSSGSDSEDEQRETEKRDRLKKLHEQLKSVLIINTLSEIY